MIKSERYKIRLKRDLIFRNIPIWKQFDEIPITDKEYIELINGNSVDRTQYSICDADVDFYIKEITTIERIIL